MKIPENDFALEILSPANENRGMRLRLDAGTSLKTAYENPDCPDFLRNILCFSRTWLLRNAVSIEEAILAPDLAPQWIAALMAWGAQVDFHEGEQLIDLANYLHRAGPHPGKIAGLHVFSNIPGRTWGEAHLGRTSTGSPIVAAMAVIDFSDDIVIQARLALTGVWRESARLAESVDYLLGSSLNRHRILTVASLVKYEITPPDNILSSSGYRREIAGEMTRRALDMCLEGNN